MRLPITSLICAALISALITVSAEIAPTITVYTEPPELEIWVDGERVGIGEVVLSGPFDDYVEVKVKGKGYKDNDKVIRSPSSNDRNLFIVITGEKKRGFSWGSLGIGLAAGLGMFCLIFAGDL